MSDAEKLIEYEKILKEKIRQTRIEEIEQFILGIVALTAMGLMYGYFAYLAFESQMKAINAFILASVIILVYIIFASSTKTAYERVFKQGVET